MTSRPRLLPLLTAAASLLAPLSVAASELSYTYVDFQATANESDQTGLQVPVPGQTVRVRTADGDGISIGGAASIGQRFYVGGRFQTAIVDVSGVISNPFGVTSAADNFDLIQSRLAFGYYRELRENFDLTVDVSLDSLEYDFGSFAGESFDMQDDGVGARVGFRWNPRPPLEIAAHVHHSSVGKADLTTLEFDADTSVGVGVMWYFFQDLGIGLEYTSGELKSAAFSMRFSFGDLGLQR